MRDQIDVLIERRNLNALSPLLDGADIDSIRYAAQQLVNALQESDEDLFEHIERLISTSKNGSHHLACQLIPHAHSAQRKKAIAYLPQLIESDDWTIRDAACEVAGQLLRKDFSRTIGVLETWRSRDSINLYRAIVIAAIRASDPMHLERAEPLLKLLEPLLSVEESIIRRNLGPSA
ncbi:MAG: DNA alkylation repair protein, partial [Candidatus Bipolaricaulota bacterium]